VACDRGLHVGYGFKHVVKISKLRSYGLALHFGHFVVAFGYVFPANSWWQQGHGLQAVLMSGGQGSRPCCGRRCGCGLAFAMLV
jgi:hypothetical protein